MIHIDLSVEPHARNCVWEDMKLAEGSRPPHTLFALEFLRAEEAESFVRGLHLGEEDEKRVMEILEACRLGEYVGVEYELMERTGQEYTCAILDIEGAQEPDWSELKDECQRAMQYLMTNGAFKDSPAKAFFIETINGAYAIANAILQHGEKEALTEANSTSGVGYPD